MKRWQTISFPGRVDLKNLPAVLREKTRGRSELITKLAVIVGVVSLGAALFFVCIYGILPSLISQVSDDIQISLADDLYKQTVGEAAQQQPEPDEAAVFQQPEPETAAVPTTPRACFASVLEENPEIVGRISIDGLDIGYLVTQTDNNDYYLSHGYNRAKSRSGAIFMDYRCDADAYPLKGHYVLYGHNMKNGSMFHKLKQLTEEETFKNNRIIRFDTLYEDHEWEIFSVYVTGTDFNYIETSFAGDDDWLKFLQDVQDKSLFKTDVKLSADDVVLTLSTCSYEFDNARFVVHARLIK